MTSAGSRLRRSLKKGAVIVPGVYDSLSALLAEEAGFPAIYLTGAGLSTSYLGKPDIGLLTLDEVVAQARRIAGAVRVPLLVDADTGFGGVFNVQRAVRELEAAGAAGIQIEDQTFPKRCGHLTGKAVISKEEMTAKIRMAVLARHNPDFLIVARTDARATGGLSEALDRAAAYKRAGADVIFPEALRSIEEFRKFGAKKILGTLMANMTEFGLSPALTAANLARLGFRLVLFPMTTFRVAAFAMKNALRELKTVGSSASLVGRMQTRQQLYALNRYREFDQREERWKG